MEASGERERRRPLRYIPLAAFLAAQPEEVETLTMTVPEIEALVGSPLPLNARFPSWWRNDERRIHSRAWLTAGWSVVEMPGREGTIVFRRTILVS